jgi:hypothetical protein
MTTDELIQAAAAIAGPIAAQSFDKGQTAPGRLQEIARAAVAIAQAIEAEARRVAE